MRHPRRPIRCNLLAGAGLWACVLAQPLHAQEVVRQVYRCAGPPVLYTDAITPAEARERGCRVIEGAPLTVTQSARRPAPASAPAAAGPQGSPPATPGGAAPRPEARVDPAVQRARDAEARRILTAELRREEERLEQIRLEFNNGEPQRRGDERNFALYQQRVDELRALIARKEADIAALRRELGKLPP